MCSAEVTDPFAAEAIAPEGGTFVAAFDVKGISADDRSTVAAFTMNAAASAVPSAVCADPSATVDCCVSPRHTAPPSP